MELSAKNFDEPDEVVELPGLLEEIVEVGGFVVGREVVAPGWRWSKDTKPTIGGEWCEAHHVGLTISGRWGAALKDGRTIEFRPGDVFDLPGGHDSWTIGEEPCVTLNWTGLRTFFASKALLPERFLTTILFTDIVGSTEQVSELGDTAWTELLTRYEQIVRGELERAHGREVTTTGDGVLAVFEGPAVALRCAAAIRSAANRLGLQIRAGTHVGEVESSGEDIRGVAVHEAAGVMAAANPDEILVSETTRVLSLPNDLEFADRGEHLLKGLDGPRLLHAYVELGRSRP
ncbi:MAG: adenylate/guanylate cyclase domain-containing protein [Actinomycetota bacterium]